ncbi:molybdenum cofactor synthesis domain protein [Turneriella parva DSM 21527]|uniref:Molybdopterin molybdenumtransferase n=1 Tax=Turneriella parva (strain ATCC BAA-1111 / DSM 21527 / NCTC 11395 / H) TaxID=869212 RepID=I4B768_TURPD|nr:molybdenum cofactor synthesis domain protein [Turneriella parva DSM 21527]
MRCCTGVGIDQARGSLLGVSEAKSLILAEARSFGTERIALERSFGRVLAENVRADRDYPPFNRSAMDGYAIVADQCATEKLYDVVGKLFAGGAAPAHLSRLRGGQKATPAALKIMTGAAVPEPFDAVIRREDARETAGQQVSFTSESILPWHNISRQGEDLQRGSTLALAGSAVDPSSVTLLASLGVHRPLVQKLPRVTIITTGNEIIPVNKKPRPTQIRNANALALRCMLARFGILNVTEKHTSDNKARLSTALKAALSSDLVLLTGGVSAGDSDYVPEVLQKLRVKQVFHKIAMKPGKPLWFGTRGKTRVFAIPGNPFSAQVCFHVYVAPFLRACLGQAPRPALTLSLAADRQKKDALEHFFPVRILSKVKSTPELELVAFNSSGDIRAGWGADGLAVHAAEKKEIRRGELVEFLPW